MSIAARRFIENRRCNRICCEHPRPARRSSPSFLSLIVAARPMAYRTPPPLGRFADRCVVTTRHRLSSPGLPAPPAGPPASKTSASSPTSPTLSSWASPAASLNLSLPPGVAHLILRFLTLRPPSAIDTVLKGNAGREITLTHNVMKTEEGWREFMAEDPPPRPGERWVFFLRSGSGGYSEVGPWGRYKIVDDKVYSMNRVLHDNNSYRAAGLDFDGLALPAFLAQRPGHARLGRHHLRRQSQFARQCRSGSTRALSRSQRRPVHRRLMGRTC